MTTGKNIVAEVIVNALRPDGGAEHVALGRIWRDGSTYLPEPVEPVRDRDGVQVHVLLSVQGLRNTVGLFSPAKWNDLNARGRHFVRDLLVPVLPARLRPLAPADRLPGERDDGLTFDALPALCRMEFHEFCAALRGQGRWSALAGEEQRAQVRGGSFEVEPDIAHLLNLLRVHLGYANLRVQDLAGPSAAEAYAAGWEAFCQRVTVMRETLRKQVDDLPLHLGGGFLRSAEADGVAVWTRFTGGSARQVLGIRAFTGSRGEQLHHVCLTIEGLLGGSSDEREPAAEPSPGSAYELQLPASASLVDCVRAALPAADAQLEQALARHADEMLPDEPMGPASPRQASVARVREH